MKNKNKVKTKTRVLITTVLVFISVLFYSLHSFWQYKRPFDINSLNLSDWTKSEYDLKFIFSKNNIFVSKIFLNSYTSKNSIFQWNTPDTRKPILRDKIQTEVDNQSEVKQIIKQLKKQKFKKIKNLSGLLQNDDHDSYSNIRYLITYKKDDIFCQIHDTFECNINGCYGLYSYFGCGQFDLEKDSQFQKEYYDILNKNDDYTWATKIGLGTLYKVKQNNSYKLLLLDLITDVGIVYSNNQGQEVCAGKGCCNTSSKNDPEFWGDWCTDDYQTVETYQPVDL